MAFSRYRSFSDYLKQRFGAPVRKLSLHAGFSCPNRDGTLSTAGCRFCAPEAYAPSARKSALSLPEQLAAGIAAGRARGLFKFMAYFQPYTNTYAPAERLRQAFNAVRAYPEIVALAIGTRPDCVNEENLGVISAFTQDYEVWIEFGLQSIHDASLRWLNRGHDAQAFFNAVALTRQQCPGVKICAHVILGLPAENAELEAQTAAALAELRVEGVKLHPLHVVTGTALAEDFNAGRFQPLTRDEYVRRVVGFLAGLWPETIIQRLTADCPRACLVAPDWLLDKSAVLHAIHQALEQDDTWQGKTLSAPRPA